MNSIKRVVEIRERGQHVFQRSELVDSIGRSLILPETRNLGAVEVTDTPMGSRLMALGLIGYLPLTNDITLNIVPKFPIQNLWTMLEVGGETYSKILPTIRSYQSTEKSVPTQMLVRSFCFYLNLAIAAGFERNYYMRRRSGYYKPRVEFNSTINQYLSRGDPINTVSNVFEFGLDNPINRLVKAACLSFARLVPQGQEWSNERRLIRYALETLQRVAVCEPSFLDFENSNTVSMRSQPHYSGMLSVYQLFLTGGGISFIFEPNGQRLPSFLFNLDDIFERFVRHSIANGLRAHGVSVVDGNKHQGRLFEDNRNFITKPDVIFRRSKKEVICIGEVKYKPTLKEADRYQLISHVTSYKAPIGIFFSPTNDNESQRLERIGRMSTGAQFYHYRIDIMGDLKLAVGEMVRDVLRVLPVLST